MASAELQYKLVRETLPVVERMISAAVDREIRNQLVVRLAHLDRCAASLRDRLGQPDFEV